IRDPVYQPARMGPVPESRPGASDGEVPELLPDAVVEVGSRELGEPRKSVAVADFRLRTRLELAGLHAVHGTVDAIPAAVVDDVEHVVGGHHESTGSEGVWRDIAHHVSGHPPGEDRTVVCEVVSGR